MLKLHQDFGALETTEDSQRLGTLFVDQKLVFGFKRVPDEQKRLKYPKVLHPHQIVLMGAEDFYSFNIQKKERGVFYVILLASLVVLIILYPMWPYPIKLGIFYLLFGILVLLAIINVLRYTLSLTCWVFGMNFWIFP
jgi:hypothetical protein